MKMKTFITGFLCLLLLPLPSFGQEGSSMKDTVVFEVPDKLIIRIATGDYAHLKTGVNLSQVINDFQDKLAQVEEYLPESEPFRIRYRHNETLLFEEKAPVSQFQVAKGKINPIILKNECYISAGEFDIRIDFKDYQDLLHPGLPEAFKSISNNLPNESRFLKILRYEAASLNDKPALTGETTNYSAIDMLGLRGGVGANMIYNRFITDITAEVSLSLGRKGIYKNQFYIANNLLFDFDAERSILLNNFTSLGYRRNTSHKRDAPNWIGIEFGTLTSRRGEFFQRNTFRLGVNWEPAKSIQVMPSLYFNGFFNQVSPGIRVGFGI
jgi:hypothetical protein